MISECPKTAMHRKIERQHLDSFRYLCSDFPRGNLQDYETPDFLIVTETQQKIGIELTQVFNRYSRLMGELNPLNRALSRQRPK
jgi:hypothetical protein